MKLTNIMPDEGYCIAVWVDPESGVVCSEKWRIINDGVVEYWDDHANWWYIVDFDNEFYSGLEIRWVVAE